MLILLSNLLFASAILAQNPFDMQFPIPELGNCSSIQECKIYCDDPSHQHICIDWAENNGFKSKAPKKDHIQNGPGGCASRQECDNFCKKKENMNTCLDFAVKDGFMTREQAEKIKKFEAKREQRRHKPKKRPEPPKPEEPKIDEEKALKILEEIGGPGGCSTMDECDIFCSTPANEETCMNFAMEHELFKHGEAERIKKMMSMEGPGGCKGRECEDFCEKPEHQIACMEFAREQGFMDEEEYQEAKKFMDATAGTGIGPGGCRNQECEEYCDNPANQDECFEFFKNAGMIDPEELELIEGMKKREIEMEMERQNEELRHKAEEQQKIWQEIENAKQHKEDESLRKFYEEFPMDTEWDKEMEQKKDEYWQKVEEQREFEEHMQEKKMQEEFKPDLSPVGLILYPFLQLLR